jgi:hypothetical protein
MSNRLLITTRCILAYFNDTPAEDEMKHDSVFLLTCESQLQSCCGLLEDELDNISERDTSKNTNLCAMGLIKMIYYHNHKFMTYH